MDLAACRRYWRAVIREFAEIPSVPAEKSTARVPNFPQLQPSSTSGSVNQPLQRVRDGISVRFDLAPGLLSRAMDGGDEGWLF
jgi:hypothetical protein